VLSLPDQIRLFSRAKLVKGELGSALHNTLFSGECTVLALNWITACQSRIAHLRGQRVGYVLPQNGPVVWDFKESERRSYKIDAEKFEQAVALCEAL
jgi:capsular polysaccharide biosynthesis protein